jgi:hypothetical protein
MPTILGSLPLRGADCWVKQSMFLNQENVPLKREGAEQCVSTAPNIDRPNDML